MTVTRLSGGLTPGDGGDPRTFPAIFNDAADVIDATAGSAVALGSAVASQGSAIDVLEALNPVQFGTAVPTDGQVLTFSTAVAGYVPEDSQGVPANAYVFVETLYFTSSGTFTKASYPWLRAIRVKCVGGGGGASGASTTSSSQISTGGPGSGGGYSEKFYTDISGLAASVTVTTGAGGTGVGSGSAGGSGGTSSFVSQTATGGGGGSGSAASTVALSFSNSGTPGSGANADFIIDGSSGIIVIATQLDRVPSGLGGASHLSGTQALTVPGGSGRNGGAGRLYGGGGQPGINANNQATARTGGAGANGIVIVELYA